ncbi:MAG TPA: Fur family transcriptional regulator, partial [Candidatus Saccharimonadia bacterium]|nr:Fur family transcriptional regulator [Candidatus Saccharimonadia bacterium]
SKDSLENLLKEHGYNITNQRLLVFETLMTKAPVSIKELIDKLANKIDRVSVYRTVGTFEKIGIIQRVNVGWKYKIELSDKFVDHHHHLICIKCREIIDINDGNIELYISQIANKHSFDVQSHQVEAQGYCKDCREVK